MLKKSPNNKIKIDILECYNNIDDIKNKTIHNITEDLDEIKIAMNDSVNKINQLVSELVDAETDLISLNEKFTKIFQVFNIEIEKMNYHTWKGEKNANANLGVLYLTTNEDNKSYSQFNLSMDSNNDQIMQLDQQFFERSFLLKYYKTQIIEIYAKYFVNLNSKLLPKFDYDETKCKKVDIIELIYGLFLSGYFKESARLKEFLLLILNLSKNDFAKHSNDIKRRAKKTSSIFQYLDDVINKTIKKSKEKGKQF